jgi:acetyltransferase-like isoleucine patch superfamily enzyme
VTNYNASFLPDEDVRRMPFRALGAGVLIDRNVSLVNIENISIGSHTRIDAYSTLIATGHISIGANVHISAFAYFAGRGGIELRDFSNISSGVRLYSVSDDFSGRTLTNPTIPEQYKSLQFGSVTVGRHAVIGAGTVVLPGVEIGEGCAIGSLCLVKQSTDPWGIYAGIPARRIRERSRELLSLEAEFLSTNPVFR